MSPVGPAPTIKTSVSIKPSSARASWRRRALASAPAHRARPLFEFTPARTEILRPVIRSFFTSELGHSHGQRSETDLSPEIVDAIRLFDRPLPQLAAFF